MRRLAFMLVILAACAYASISWTHDLAIGHFDIQYQGDHASAGTRSYQMAPGQQAVVRVEVRNQSPNPSMPYQVIVRAGNTNVGTAQGSSLPSNGTREHTFNWVSVPGSYPMTAEIVLTRRPPGGDPKKVCSECRRSGKCAWPSNCYFGSAGQMCSCHTATDNEANNRAQIQIVAGGGPAPTPPPTGPADLVVGGISSSPMAAKGMGTALVVVTIANKGGQDVRGAIKVAVTVEGINAPATLTGGLRAGESKSVSVEVHKGGRASAVVDPDNQVKEANETNNTGTGYVSMPTR